MISADYHLHSFFSADSDTPMEEMVQQGIRLGLTHMCFTDHLDYDYYDASGKPTDMFDINTDSYLYEILQLREKYAGQITINFGIELGLQPHLMRKYAVYAKSYDFDFIIASMYSSSHCSIVSLSLI